MDKIVEIFSSIEGEGSLVGYPVTFIRLEGCNLRCSWCDTKYSYDTNNYKLMTLNEILEVVKNYKNKKVCLTGGEPLYNEHFDLLVNTLKKEYFLIIETNGTLYRNSITDNSNIYVVCSPKPDTNYYLNEKLKPFVKEIKLIVDDNLNINVIKKFKNFPIILQPEGNKQIFMDKALDLQRKCLELDIETRIIPQIHKCFNLK